MEHTVDWHLTGSDRRTLSTIQTHTIIVNKVSAHCYNHQLLLSSGTHTLCLEIKYVYIPEIFSRNTLMHIEHFISGHNVYVHALIFPEIK